MTTLSYTERQEKARQMQAAISEATEAIDRAKKLSNELQVGFEILGLKYLPLKIVTQGGRFSNEPAQVTDDWDSSEEDSWSASGIGC